MRAFVAVVPPAEVLMPLADALPTLREHWPHLGWIPPERWHLTLCFLGDVTDDTIEILKCGWAEVAGEMQVIPAAVAGGGTFPGGRRARVAWVGVEAGPGLVALAERVTAQALAAGVEVDERPYRAHITLARVRQGSVEDHAELREALSVARGGDFTIDRLVLFRSHLGPKPRYEELDAWSLQRA